MEIDWLIMTKQYDNQIFDQMMDNNYKLLILEIFLNSITKLPYKIEKAHQS